MGQTGSLPVAERSSAVVTSRFDLIETDDSRAALHDILAVR